MKKIWLITLGLLSVFLLAGCATYQDLYESLRPDVYAPELTPTESEFVEMVDILKNSSVAISNTYTEGLESVVKRGSAVVVKKVVSGFETTYYAITTQSVVTGSVIVKVLVTATIQVDATVLNPKLTFESDEDIAIVRFQSSVDLTAIEMTPLEDISSIDTRQIFSIGTPISTGYFNYLSNPATIMGIQGNILVHGTNLNYGMVGSPLYLKETGQFVGINTYYSTTIGGRPEVLINHAIVVNQVISLTESYL